MLDLIAGLGSRATVPREVRAPGGLERYVDLVAPGPADDAEGRVAEIVAAARARRRLDPDRLRALLRALADPPTAEVNHASLARACGVPATTLPPYLALLAELDVVRLLPGTRSPLARRAVARPRAVWTEPRLAAHLAGASRADLLDLSGRRLLAPLLHGLVARHLLEQQEARAQRGPDHRLGHLRERNGLAVDLVVDLPDGSAVGFEVRTAGAFRPHQFARLEALRARVGPRLRLGVVLLAAPAGHRYRPHLWTLPLAAALGDEDAVAGLG